MDATNGWTEARSESFQRAADLAEKARALDDSDPDVHALLGSLLLSRRQHEQAIAEGEKAVALGPNHADSHALLAMTKFYAGRPEEAVELVQKAMRLQPYYPPWYIWALGHSYRVARRYEEAVTAFDKLLELGRKGQWDRLGPHLALAECYVLLGRDEKARSHVEEVLKIDPDYSLEAASQYLGESCFYQDPAQESLVLDALRKAGVPEAPPLPLPEKPSIAVLPFTNVSDDPGQEYFCDGITEDLITDLSKISGLFVIARNSSFTYKGKAVNVKIVKRELGVRYVLEGSVRKAGGRVRITAQLVDAATGGHLWAERYDRNLRDIFDLQDEVTNKIVDVLEVKLTQDEQQSVTHKQTKNLEAYDYVLRGLERYYETTKEANVRAREMFKKSIELDREYALAHSLLGLTYLTEWMLGWSHDPQTLKRASERAKLAITLDDSLPAGHSLLGEVHLWEKHHDEAIAELETAIALDPNYADGYAGLANILCWAGRAEEAIALMKKAMRLNPEYPDYYLWNLGHAYYLTGRYENAIAPLKDLLTRNQRFFVAYIYLAAIYIELGREHEARAAADTLIRSSPHVRDVNFRDRIPYKESRVRDKLFHALGRAGLR
jgi:TolB-like protein/predicted Zn-dependent protease